MPATAYPLAWPEGWPRAKSRKYGHFGKVTQKPNQSWKSKSDLSIADAVKRIRVELDRLRVDTTNDMVISTNLALRLDGLPRSDQREPNDPGAAVYWQRPGQPMRVMAIDVYQRVADNLAAIAATLEAMRAIERHGGAQILERAFTGFSALPPPASPWDVLGIPPRSTKEQIEAAYRGKARTAHPDTGGSTAAMAALNAARDAALKEIGS